MGELPPPGAVIKKISISPAQGEKLRDLLEINEGEPFTQEALQTSLKNIFRVGVYSDVKALWKADGDGIILSIELEEIPKVEGITIRGGAPLSRQQILSLTRLDRDPRFESGRDQMIIRLLRERYMTLGYYAADVQIYAMTNLGTGGVRLEIDIDSGDPTIIRAIEFKGSPELAAEEIIEVFKETAVGRQLKEAGLRNDIRRLQDYYIRRSFLTVDIQKPILIPDYDMNDISVELTINAGPLIEVNFSPADVDSVRPLDLIPFQDRNVPLDRIVANGETKILQQLIAEGHKDAAVQASIRMDEEAETFAFNEETGAIIIDVAINKGIAYKVRNFQVSGIRKDLEKQIIPQLKLTKKGWFHRVQYSKTALEDDKRRVLQLLRSAGYDSPTLASEAIEPAPALGSIDIKLVFDPGPLQKIGKIEFNGNEEIPDEVLLQTAGLNEGDTITSELLSSTLNSLISFYDSRGFAEAKIGYGTVRSGALTNLIFNIDERQRSRVKKMIIAGNEITSEKVIKRALKLREDRVFSRRLASESQRMLYRLGIFTRVQIQTIDEELEPPERRLVVRVDEASPYSILYGFGVDSEERFRFSFGFSNINLAGRNMKIGFNTRVSHIQQRHQLSFSAPRLIKGFQESAVRLFYEEDQKPGYAARRKGMLFESVGLDWRGWDLTGRYQYKWIDLFDVKPNYVIPRFDSPIRLSLLSFVLTRDKRDDLINPNRGYLTSVITQYAPGWLGSQVGYLKNRFQFFNYAQIQPGTVFAMGLRLGLAWPLSDSEDVPISERFFAGGSTSLRGFKLDYAGPLTEPDETGKQYPLGGNALLVANLELRLQLLENVGGVVFYDFGNVFPSISDLNLYKLTHSLGIGFRYNTPLGPLRVDYGKSLRSKDFGFFFSVGHAF